MTEQTNNEFMDIGISLTTEAVEAASTVHVQLRLYDIFIPLLGIFIILLNLLVVISSGIILKKGKSSDCSYNFLLWHFTLRFIQTNKQKRNKISFLDVSVNTYILSICEIIPFYLSSLYCLSFHI